MPEGLHASEVISIDDAETIRAAGGELLKAARGAHRTAAAVHSDWLHLVWCYHAPEQQQVWDAMRPPAKKALELSDDVSLVDAALGRYADRMAELEVERTSLVADIVALNGEIADMRANDESNRWYNNVADWVRHEDVNLLEEEDRLNRRMGSLRARKELAEIDFGNEIATLWGAPGYQFADRGNVKSPYKYGASTEAYLSAVGSSDAPWSGPSLRMTGDWTTKVAQLDQGAQENLLDGLIYVADVAGATAPDRTEFARSGLKQFGNDVWTLAEPLATRSDPNPQYAESLMRMGATAQGAVGYGTWTTDGWNTAGTFLPGLGAAVATRGMAAPPLLVMRGSMVAGRPHIPVGMRLHPALVIPAIQLRTSQAFAGSKTRLTNAIDTSLTKLDGAFGAPAPAASVAPSRATTAQTPPLSLSTLRNEAAPSAPKDARGPNPSGPQTLGAQSRSSTTANSGHDVPELTWAAKHDKKNFEATHDPEIAAATLPLVEKARAADPQATANFLAALPEGARPHGLEHRIKSPESIAHKIDRKSETATFTETAGKMTDVVRYTSVVPNNADLISSAKVTVENMKADGWTIVQAQHSYVEGSPYKGIHCQMRSEDLEISVELQFHTEKSQAVKESTHIFYELARDPATPPAEKSLANAQLREASAAIPHPDDLDTFHELGGVHVERLVYTATRK